MARKLIVEVILDAAAYSRQIKKTEAQTAGFASNLQKTGKQAAVAAVSFKGLGKSVAFATGGLVAFHSGTEFLRESVDAAREAGVAQRSLAAQMQAAGESFKANREAIDEAARAYAQFGFQNDEVIQSLTVLERGTGKIDNALKLEMLTADIARAKNLELSQAAAAVAKVFGGQETALRRAVPGLQKTAHGWDLIREAQAKMAGQAAAATTPAEQFQAQLHDTQETIGKALIPVLDKFLTKLTAGMTKLNEAANSQKGTSSDLRKTAHLFGEGLHFAGVGAQFLGDHVHVANKSLERTKFLFHEIGNLNDRLFPAELSDRVETFTTDLQTLIQTAPPPKYRDLSKGGIQIPGDVTADDIKRLFPGPYRASADEKARRSQQWFDAMIGRKEDRIQDIGNLNKQVRAWDVVEQLILKRMKVTKDATYLASLSDQLVQAQRSRGDVLAQIAGNAAARKAAAKAAQDAATVAQENRILFGIERAEATKGVKDDIAWRKKYNGWLHEQLRLHKGSLEIRKKIWENDQEINRLRKGQPGDRDPLAGLMQVSSGRLAAILAAGTGIGAGGMNRLVANIAGQEISVYNHINMDGREVAASVNTVNARTGRRTAKQTSGGRG